MSPLIVLLLITTVIASVLRGLLSKKMAFLKFGEKAFFTFQASLFGMGSAAIFAYCLTSSGFACAPLTALWALIYGLLLISAQWCYTAALSEGDISSCSTVYSLGFVIPTFSGLIFWHEPFSIPKVLGGIIAIGVIFLSNQSLSKPGEGMRKKTVMMLLIATVSSGGLGIMQKVQQTTGFAEQRSVFLLLSFFLAAAVSAGMALLAENRENTIEIKNCGTGAAAGFCFASANLLNTYLAGKLETAVLFPIQNIGVILLSMIMGLLMFKERLTKRKILVFVLSLTAILLINM